jgi:hypothetical protein
MNAQGSGIGDLGSGPRPKKRSWIPIVIGIFLLFAVVAVGAIVLTAMWFRESMTISRSSEDAATKQFEDVRRKFPGQEPLIQLVDGRPQYAANRTSQAEPRAPLTSVHVIAYDRDEGNTVTFSLPFWLLRMKSGPIRISAYQQGWDDRGVSFRVEDIEKHGPGIIVDVTDLGSVKRQESPHPRDEGLLGFGYGDRRVRGACVIQAGAPLAHDRRDMIDESRVSQRQRTKVAR